MLGWCVCCVLCVVVVPLVAMILQFLLLRTLPIDLWTLGLLLMMRTAVSVTGLLVLRRKNVISTVSCVGWRYWLRG